MNRTFSRRLYLLLFFSITSLGFYQSQCHASVTSKDADGDNGGIKNNASTTIEGEEDVDQGEDEDGIDRGVEWANYFVNTSASVTGHLGTTVIRMGGGWVKAIKAERRKENEDELEEINKAEEELRKLESDRKKPDLSAEELADLDGRISNLTVEIKRLKAERAERIQETKAEVKEVKQATFDVMFSGGRFFKESAEAVIETNREIKKKTAEQRQERLARVAVQGKINEGIYERAKIDNEAMMERLKFLTEPTVLRNVTLALGGATTLCAGGYYGSKLAYAYGERMLGRPKIVLETTVPTFLERLFRIRKKQPSRLDEFVPPPGIKDEIERLARLLPRKVKEGRPLPSILCYGPTGTGKTMIARELARRSGAYFDIISGPSFAQSPEGQDIADLNAWLDSREYISRVTGVPIVMFIDEAESFCCDRHLPTTSERSKKLLNAFLTRIEKASSKKLMFIYATNFPETIDRALWSRVGPKLEFRLPELEQREKLLAIYLNKHLVQEGISVDDGVRAHVIASAEKLDGFSGREIEDLWVYAQGICDDLGAESLTTQIVDEAVERYIAQHEFAVQCEQQNVQQYQNFIFAGQAGGLQMRQRRG